MARQTIHLDFRSSGNDPRDGAVDNEGARQAIALFEQAADEGKLGPHFAGLEPDIRSLTHLFIHVDAVSPDELLAFRGIVHCLHVDCRTRADRDSFVVDRQRTRVGQAYPLDVRDRADDAQVRQALWLWAHKLIFRVGDEGWISRVVPELDKTNEGPISLHIDFEVPRTADPDALKQRFAEALGQERQRLEAGLGTSS